MILTMVINLALLAGAIWVIVTLLRVLKVIH